MKFDENLNVLAENKRVAIKIDPISKDLNIIAKLDDEPNDVQGLTSTELKHEFDKSGLMIQEYINDTLIPAVVTQDATEADRAAAEAARVEAESKRVQAETGRVDAESKRVQAEEGRVSAEAARVEAEQARADETAGIVAQATEQANNAAGSAGAAADSAVAADQSATKAASSASDASASAISASGSAADSASSASDAKNSAIRASSRADDADASAKTATAAAQRADESAGAASGSAGDASKSAVAANGSASAAKTSETNAAASAAAAAESAKSIPKNIVDGVERGSAGTSGSRIEQLGPLSFSEGSGSIAQGTASHAEGFNTMASATASHAECFNTAAYGSYSHSEGALTQAMSRAQHVQGEYNIVDTDGTPDDRGKYAHIVGNGRDTARSNAHTLAWDGTSWYAGPVKTGGTGQDDPNAKTLATTEDVPTVDATLANAGDAADAKATGDAINQLSLEKADRNKKRQLAYYTDSGGTVVEFTADSNGNPFAITNFTLHVEGNDFSFSGKPWRICVQARKEDGTWVNLGKGPELSLPGYSVQTVSSYRADTKSNLGLKWWQSNLENDESSVSPLYYSFSWNTIEGSKITGIRVSAQDYLTPFTGFISFTLYEHTGGEL